MKKIVSTLLLLFITTIMYSQKINEYEEFTRKLAKLLGVPNRSLNEIIATSYSELFYMSDDIAGKYYIQHYGCQLNSSIVNIISEDLPWYQYGKSVSIIMVTNVSNESQILSITRYFDSRTVFLKLSSNKYKYLSFSNPLSDVLKSMGYDNIIFEFTENKSNGRLGYKDLYTLDLKISLLKS